MAHYKFDLVQETSTSTGTGALTLAGAVTRRQAFSAVLSNADTCYVLIESASAAEWEISLATYNSGGNTLSRGTVLSSSTGSAVSFSAGTKTISLIAPAAKSIVEDNNGDVSITRDAAIGRNATVAGTLGVTGTLSGAAASFSGNMGSQTLTVNYGSTSSISTVALTNTGVNGISIAMTGNGATTPTKYLRVLNGNFEIINNAYSAAILALTDAGALNATTSLSAGTTVNAANGYLLSGDLIISRGGNYTTFAGGSSGTYGNMTLGNSVDPSTYLSATNHYIRSANGVTTFATVNSTGLLAGTDNTMTLGGASNRWSVVYAATGSINTSGRAAKLFIGEANTAEKRAAATIKAKPRRYKLKDSVDEKGEARARWHFGYVAEDVRDALAAEKLDPWAYAFLCSDPLIKRETYFETATRAKMRKVTTRESAVEIIDGKPVMVAKQVERDEPVGVMVAVVDEAGQPVMRQAGTDAETGEPIIAPLMHFVPEMEEYQAERTREVDTGEVRLGLRYSELEAFLRSAD
jgi:hypothetical protein